VKQLVSRNISKMSALSIADLQCAVMAFAVKLLFYGVSCVVCCDCDFIF
jgi:hypothetical protein